MAAAAAEVQQAVARAESASRAAAAGKGMDTSPTYLSDVPPWAINESGDYLLMQCKCASPTHMHSACPYKEGLPTALSYILIGKSLPEPQQRAASIRGAPLLK